MPQLIVFAALIGLMYVMLILPQQRRVKSHQAMIDSLEVGDEVMTTAGIYGTITAIDDDVAMLEVAPSIELRIALASIGQRATEPDEDDADEPGDEAEELDGEDPVE